MSLPHALLTALIERPCSGSELAKRFDRSIGYFWQATHQQIYKELRQLELAGFVEGTAVDGARGRKKSYRVLKAGHRELKRWVSGNQSPAAIRDELMVRIRAEAIIGPTDLADELEKLAEKHRNNIEIYQNIERKDFVRSSENRQLELQHFVLRAGIDFENLRLAFCEGALLILRASSQEDGG